MEDPIQSTEESYFWMKLTLFQRVPLTKAMYSFFHNENQMAKFTLPREPNLLYQELQKYRTEVKKSKFIKKDQTSLIYPDNGQTDSSEFDVTLLAALIDALQLHNNDKKIRKIITEARKWRNDLLHNQKIITEGDFETRWAEGERILQYLKFTYDTKTLKECPLDIKTTHKKLLQEYKEKKNGKVLEEVFDVVCEKIDNHWLLLAKKLLENSDDLEEIVQNQSIDNKENMRQTFEKIGKSNILWTNLRDCLKIVGRIDLIDEILKSTLVTIGRKNASDRLRTIYENELRVVNVDQIFEDHTTQSDLNESYVELAIIDARDMDKTFKVNDGEFYRQLKHFDHRKVEMHEILTRDRPFVIVRGIAGIGKSTMINTYTYRWAKRELLSNVDDEQSVNANFLFKLTCRDMNTLTDDFFESVESLLSKKFPEIFNFISMEDLREMHSSVLILVDGMDELRDFPKFNDNQDQIPLLQCVRKLINPLSEELRGHTTMVVGRPEACDAVRTFCVTGERKSKIGLETIEIIGFNEESIESFIKKKFKENPDRIPFVKEKILNSEHLSNMARIPIYLWVICQLYHEREDMEHIQNTTQLCTYAILLFIKSHLRAQNCDDEIEMKTLLDLCEDKDICNEVLLLAELSMITYQDRKVIFTKEDIGKIVKIERFQTEKSGFIVKKDRMYQFRHLVLQEYLTALFILLTGETSKLENEKFSSCLPVVAGLHGFEKRGKSHREEIVPCFLKNLRGYYDSKLGFFKKIPKKVINVSQTKVQTILENKFKEVMLNSNDTNHFEINGDCSNLMTASHEFACPFTKDFKKHFDSRTVSIRNLIFQHDIKHAISFLKKIDIHSIKYIDITNFGNNQLPSNIAKLFEYFFQNTSFDKRFCIFSIDEEMSITSRGDYEGSEKCLIIKFVADKKRQDQHNHLLSSLVSMVTKITVEFSLGPYYSHLKKEVEKHQRKNNTETPKLKHPNLRAFDNIDKPSRDQIEIASDAIVAAYESSKEYQRCIIKNKDLNDDHITGLQSCIEYIQELDLTSNNKLTETTFVEMANLLKPIQNAPLERLNLTNCSLSENQIKAISELLQNTSIKFLLLDCNANITLTSMCVLKESIIKRFKSEKPIVCLSMKNCDLNDDLVQESLPAFPYIQEVILEQNPSITSNVLSALVNHTLNYPEDKYVLKTLNLSQTKITHECFDTGPLKDIIRNKYHHDILIKY